MDGAEQKIQWVDNRGIILWKIISLYKYLLYCCAAVRIISSSRWTNVMWLIAGSLKSWTWGKSVLKSCGLCLPRTWNMRLKVIIKKLLIALESSPILTSILNHTWNHISAGGRTSLIYLFKMMHSFVKKSIVKEETRIVTIWRCLWSKETKEL